MELEQHKIRLIAKDDITVLDFFQQEYPVKKGDILDGIVSNISGVILIGIMVNGELSYYYESNVVDKFEVEVIACGKN